MTKIFQDTTFEPKIILEQVEGNLRIKGWDRPEVRFDADNANDLEITQDGTTFTVHCHSNLYLRLPSSASIEIKDVQGSANFKSVEEKIHIAGIQGNATFKLLGAIEIENLEGNLTASNIEGSLVASRVEGNVNIRDVEEVLSIQNIGGNFNYHGTAAEITCTVGGNANLRLETEPGGDYKVKADGSISCNLEVPTGASFELLSQTKKINVETAEGSEVINAKQHDFKIGDGDIQIHLEAGKKVSLKVATFLDDLNDGFNMDHMDDLSSLADEITQQVTDQVDAQMASLNEQLSNLTIQFDGASSERARRKVQQAQRRLELKLAATKRRAERQARKARSGRPLFTAAAASFNLAKNKNEPVSDDERGAILQMLQDKKITVEEAEMLLAALEGELTTEPNTPEAPEPPDEPKG